MSIPTLAASRFRDAVRRRRVVAGRFPGKKIGASEWAAGGPRELRRRPACGLRRGRQVPKKPPRVTLSCARMFGFYRRLLWGATTAIVTVDAGFRAVHVGRRDLVLIAAGAG